jgi:hypothetical protein
MSALRRVCLTCMAISVTAAAWGQSTPCDPQLLQRSTDPNAYRLRGDRCEGIYIQEVGGSPLFVASWTETFADYDPLSRQPLQIDWDPLPGADAVRLRAQGLRRRLYYRMDAVRPAGSKSFKWPSDLLAGLGINRSDLGVLGIAHVNAGGAERDVYLPLRITQSARAARNDGYQLVILPGVELREVFLTLASFHAGKATILKNAVPLGYGYYPADRAVEIPISRVPANGLYHLEIGATLRTGGASTAELWFYASGK